MIGGNPQGHLRCKMIPVACGTSYKNKGVQKLLDAIVDYMPSRWISGYKGVNPDTDKEDEASSRMTMLLSPHWRLRLRLTPMWAVCLMSACIPDM